MILSAGIVVVRKETKEWKYLFLRAYKNWDFPKGIVESTEAPIETAKREVKEEAGITDLNFRWGDIFKETLPYSGGKKIARYYIAETSQSTVTFSVNPELGKPEHHEYRWLSYDEIKKLSPKRLLTTIEWANSLINQNRYESFIKEGALKNISISREWRAAAEAISKKSGIFLVVGVPDSGKSTLSRYLIHYLTHASRIVALIDCDVGQTHLGPPTTLGMMLYTNPTDPCDTLKPDHMRFIGATSPTGHLLDIVVATKKMADKALNSGAEVVIVNTSGLILGVAGAKLKLNKVDLLCPKYMLALQESSEIEHLLTYLEKRHAVSTFRLPISEHARKRPPEVRRRFREEKYREYFRESQIVKMPFSQIGPQGYVWCRERNVRIDAIKHLLLGLCDSENYLLALGVLQEFDLEERSLHILTPLSFKDGEKVRAIQLGEIKIHPNGQEEYVHGGKNLSDHGKDSPDTRSGRTSSSSPSVA